jgi:hypothetical protein
MKNPPLPLIALSIGTVFTVPLASAEVLFSQDFDNFADGIYASSTEPFGFTTVHTGKNGDADSGDIVISNGAAAFVTNADGTGFEFSGLDLNVREYLLDRISFEVSYDIVSFNQFTIALKGPDGILRYRFVLNNGDNGQINSQLDISSNGDDPDFTLEPDTKLSVILELRGTGADRSGSLIVNGETVFSGVKFNSGDGLSEYFNTLSFSRFNGQDAPTISLDNVVIEGSLASQSIFAGYPEASGWRHASIGWVDDALYPYVYVYAAGHSTWLYIYADGATVDSYHSYHYLKATWIWASDLYGDFYYNYNLATWEQFSSTAP